MQEQLHAAHARIAAAEQTAVDTEQLRIQLESLQSHRKVWDQVLQVQSSDACAAVTLSEYAQ